MLYLVEVELAVHDPLRHIAQQLLNFSLSFKSTPQKMKGILRNTLQTNAEALKKCEQYYPAGLTLPRCAKAAIKKRHFLPRLPLCLLVQTFILS